MLSKSYRLLNYLNRPHRRLSRIFFGANAWLGSLILSRDIVLARWAQHFFLSNDFKQGFRVSAWLLRVSFPRLHIWGDHFFDFTEGGTGLELESMERFLQRKQGGKVNYISLSDELYVLGARVHESIKQSGGNPDVIDPLVHQYYAKANELLRILGSCHVEYDNKKKKPRLGDFSAVHAKQALKDFALLFPNDEWPWYLVSGTLLGMYRDGGFLSHDYDIDLGINDGEFDAKAMLLKLNNHPAFVVKKVDHHLAVGRETDGYYVVRRYLTMYKVIHENGINIDVFIHHRDRDMLWHGSIIHRWDNTSYSLSEYELAGISVLGPDDPERYLAENYGDWRTPITDFDCTTGTPNLVIAKNFLSVALFLKRLGHFAHHDPRQYEKLKATLLRSDVLSEHNEVLQLDTIL